MTLSPGTYGILRSDGTLREIVILNSPTEAKSGRTLPVVITPKPGFNSATQKVVQNGWTVNVSDITPVWQVVSNTPEELDKIDELNQLTQSLGVLSDIKVGTGTVTERLARLEGATFGLLKHVGLPPPAVLPTGSGLEFFVQPSGATDGLALNTQPVVRVVDNLGALDTSSSAKITIFISSGAGAISVKTAKAVDETLTVAALNGVATFSGLILNGSGPVILGVSGRRLDGTPISSTSSSVTIVSQPATKLALLIQPSGGQNTVDLRQQPVIEVQDSRGRRVRSGSVNVTASILSGTGALSGNVTVSAVSGLATFTNLAISGGGAHTLRFISSGLVTVDSLSTSVSPYYLPPTSIVNGGGATNRVEIAPSPSIDNLAAFTWLFCEYATSSSTGPMCFMRKGTNSGAAGNIKGLDRKFGDVDDFSFIVKRATTDSSVDSVGFNRPLNQWVWIAATFDGTNGCRLYGGKETADIAEMTYSAKTTGAGLAGDDSGAKLYIGNRESFDETFVGRMGMAAIYDSVLTAAQMLSWQKTGAFPTGAKCLLRLGENGAAVQADESGNGNTGTVLGGLADPVVENVVTITPTTTYQTIQGFGTTERVWDDPHTMNTSDPSTGKATAASQATSADRELIMHALYTELGLTRIRHNPNDTGHTLPIESSNDNSDPANSNIDGFNFAFKRLDSHLDYNQQAAAYGATTVFSAPLDYESWMSAGMDVQEYAEWALQQIKRWAASGKPLTYWSFMNEPSNGSQGFTASGGFIRDCIKALGPRIASAGITCPIVVPDDINSESAYATLPTILSDPIARSYVGAVAYHLYGGADNRANIKTLAADTYGIPIWMTEWYSPDVLTWAGVMHDHLTKYGCSAVDYLWGFFGDWDGTQATLITLDTSGGNYAGFTKLKQFYVMGQWSRFVRPGSRRIASTNSGGVNTTAFTNGNDTIYVLVNTNASARQVEIDNGALALSGKKIFAYRTSASENWVEVAIGPRYSGRIDLSLAAASVTTIVVRP